MRLLPRNTAKSFKNTSIRAKILFITITISLLALFFSFSIFLVYDYINFKNKTITDVKNLATLIGNNVATAVSVRGKIPVQFDLYQSLSLNKNIQIGVIFDSNNEVFAYYDKSLFVKDLESDLKTTFTRNDSIALHYSNFKPVFQEESTDFQFSKNYLDVFLSVRDEKQQGITVFLKSDLEVVNDRYLQYLTIIGGIVILAMFFVYLISLSLQKIVSAPILNLANTTRNISLNKDFTIRIPEKRKDEVGTLIDNFNEMLGVIVNQNKALIEAKDEAEDLAQEANKQAKIAEESSKAKEQFLANMSHEIRTPLNGIMGMRGQLADTTLSSKQKRYVDIIKSSSDDLLVIINDILDLSKIHAGELVLEEKPVNITTIIDAIVFSCSPKIGNKPIKTVVEIDEKIPNTIISDPVRLKQVLLNLFTNAIKFTFQGTITIGAELLEEAEDDMLIKFFVKDTGIGIEKSKHKMIFSSFTQASSDTTRKFGGTGLGLSICKELVEMQGGTIHLESHPGLGSIFSFDIRFKRNPYPEIEEEQATNENYELLNTINRNTTQKVLLAEDNEINQMLVVDILESWDFKVDVANNGEEAIEMLEQNNYSLILMDVHMPKLDGYGATKAIRKDFNGLKANIPIVAMTAAALKGEVERCISVGMNDYISKPFEKHELYEKIIKHIKD